MTTTKLTTNAHRLPSGWLMQLCLMAVLLLFGASLNVSADNDRDILTFTGGQQDPNNPDIYVIDVGNVPATILDPESYEWSNVEEYFTVTLRRTNTAHAATITLKDPVGHGEILVEFPAGVSEQTVKLNQT